MSAERLIGWREINRALAEIAGISHSTAKRWARYFAVPLIGKRPAQPVEIVLGKVYGSRQALKAWWERVRVKAFQEGGVRADRCG